MVQANKLTVDNHLTQATCAVLIDGKVVGTAWLFSQEGHLLTAGHILGKQRPRTQVEVRFSADVPRQAHKVQHVYAYESGIDFAILKLAESPVGRFPMPIAFPESVEGNFVALGYGKSLVDRSSGSGAFAGFFDPQNSSANRLFKLESTQLGEPGYSGCAIFSKGLGTVVALQMEATLAKTGAERDTVLAMPLYRVANLWPTLKYFATTLKEYCEPEQKPPTIQEGISFTDDSIGLTPNIYKRLQKTLLKCGPFASDEDLKSVFIDTRINIWRNAVPQANSPIKRVRAIIDLLYNQYVTHTQGVTQESALVLFLRVLSDQLDTKNICHYELVQLANEIESEKRNLPQSSYLYDKRVPIENNEYQTIASENLEEEKMPDIGKLLRENRQQKRELVNILLSCAAMSDLSTREAIVNDLPDKIKNTIQRSNVNRVHVNNIVTRCLSYAGGIEELLTLIRDYEEEDSVEMQNVDALIQEIKGI